MGGGGGPSSGDIRRQQQHEAAMMQMQQQMMQQQMEAQMAMLKYQLEQADIQRKAAEQAAKDAAIQTQSNTAQQAAAQNQQSIASQLTGLNTTQQLQDQAASDQYQQAISSGAETATGGFDLATSKADALQQLGAASGTLPQTPSNLLGQMSVLNPAATTAEALNQQTGGTTNQQNLAAQQSGLVFGGT